MTARLCHVTSRPSPHTRHQGRAQGLSESAGQEEEEEEREVCTQALDTAQGPRTPQSSELTGQSGIARPAPTQGTQTCLQGACAPSALHPALHPCPITFRGRGSVAPD